MATQSLTTYGPMQGIPFARSTARGKTVYVHVFDWPGASMDLPGLDAKSGVQPLCFLAASHSIFIRAKAKFT